MRSAPLLALALLLVLGCAAPGLDPGATRAAAAASQRSDWPRAIELWSQIHRASRGGSALACRELASALVRAGSLEPAHGVLAPALARFPEDPRLWQLAGELALAQDRGQDAREAWVRSLRLDPGHTALAARLADLAWEQDEPRLVLAALDPAALAAQQRGPLHLLRARALCRLGAEGAALEEYLAAFAAGAGAPTDRLSAARLALHAPGRATSLEAERWLEDVRQERPQWSEAHRLLAQARLDRDDWAGAAEPALRAAELAPDDPEALLVLARVRRASGARAQALALLEQARSLAPEPGLSTRLAALRAAWSEAEPQVSDVEPVSEVDP